MRSADRTVGRALDDASRRTVSCGVSFRRAVGYFAEKAEASPPVECCGRNARKVVCGNESVGPRLHLAGHPKHLETSDINY